MTKKLTRSTIESHVKELRHRLVLAIVAYIIGTCICFHYAVVINDFLLAPLVEVMGADGMGRKLIFTGLAEGFFNHMHIAMYAGFIIAFPIIAWQIYFFIAPGLYRSEKRILIPFLLAAPTLFLAGSSLAYYYLMPIAWKFFLSFEQTGIIPIVLEARISEYLSIVLELVVGFGLAFQLPLVMVALVKLGIVNASSLSRQRRYAIVAIFIIAAIMTPPDVVSQIALALPLLLLYEISLLICHKIEKNKDNHDRYKNNP